MNQTEQNQWKSEVLDEVFSALAAAEEKERCLVFKGARVLNARLGGGRQSLDLDCNLTRYFVNEHPNREEQKSYLERYMKQAIFRHFQTHDPVRFDLRGLTASTYPPKSHPMGWDAFKFRLNVDDLKKSGVRGLPTIEIDVAAPEELLETSISPLIIGNHRAYAYTLERIAGEKLRAFLSSLPTYRDKFRKPGGSVRAKDLYDLARIQRVIPMGRAQFWTTVGQEFRIACHSRYIDCSGLETFTEHWEVTSETYVKDPTIPPDIQIDEALATLEMIVQFLMEKKVIPFEFPMPPLPG